MAPTLYPRATLKKIVKAHANRPLSRNVDILIYLNYMLFVQELMREAGIRAKMAGERGVSAKGIRRVREGCLRRAKG
ncbi:uncharacterized protein M421DRAFT_6802 [Didymella exigua CBS 183.55]|uniref:Transcription factor CBF/NF-Y/archaeal histone domain-containing protein n=1 Tax=Didymella exigua CBS 183.55 TaxID=1150837 RepID=A0A6A5RHB6_9PLEO|nr:uncharacterized protein M421DRAFT_6802 [Didymella exigua CBS 183.55]KAF1926518.1 hypothetical protein M421DRAFT_6802 [Didymella exigua CBS 183.55]